MIGLSADGRYAARFYLRTPVASFVAIFTLVVAIAFLIAFLSLYVGLTLRNQPGYPDSSEIASIDLINENNSLGVSGPLFEELQKDAPALTALVGVIATQAERTQAQPLEIEVVTSGFFQGMNPFLHSGRGFDQREHMLEGSPVAVVSYRYWRDELLEDANVLGMSIELKLPSAFPWHAPGDSDTREFRIIGVMSPDVGGLAQEHTDIWLPLEQVLDLHGVGGMLTFGRRSPGTSINALRSELNGRYGNRDEYGLGPGSSFEVANGVVRDIQLHYRQMQQLQLFLLASILLAIVAASNASLFLLARAPERRRELSIRMVVGARFVQLARQLVLEAAIFVLIATTIGVLLSFWLAKLLAGLPLLRSAEWSDVTMLDWRLIIVVGMFFMLFTPLVALAPIAGLHRTKIMRATNRIRAKATALQRLVGTVQMATVGALGGAAIAFAWHMAIFEFGYPGYEIDNRYLVQFSVDDDFRGEDGLQRMRAFQAAQVVEIPRRRSAIEAVPGITAIAFGDIVPGQSNLNFMPIVDPAQADRMIQTTTGLIDNQYIEILGLTLLTGRPPNQGEANVAIVNESFARMYFGREDAVGEFVPLAAFPNAPRLQVIGVLRDLPLRHPADDPEPTLFRSQSSSVASTAIIESALTSAQLYPELERVTAQVSPDLRVVRVESLEQMRRNALASDRARTYMTAWAAILVVSLAAFGFYGMQSYLVDAGSREYAIRAALGAGPRSLIYLVSQRALFMSLPGLLLGAVLAFIVVGILSDSYVSDSVSPYIVTASVTIILVAVLLLAAAPPAFRAKRIQPSLLLDGS